MWVGWWGGLSGWFSVGRTQHYSRSKHRSSNTAASTPHLLLPKVRGAVNCLAQHHGSRHVLRQLGGSWATGGCGWVSDLCMQLPAASCWLPAVPKCYSAHTPLSFVYHRPTLACRPAWSATSSTCAARNQEGTASRLRLADASACTKAPSLRRWPASREVPWKRWMGRGMPAPPSAQVPAGAGAGAAAGGAVTTCAQAVACSAWRGRLVHRRHRGAPPSPPAVKNAAICAEGEWGQRSAGRCSSETTA